jgi:hypothetical protein
MDCLQHLHWVLTQRHYIRRLCIGGVERLWWSFCLVWRPSSEEFHGTSHLLIPLSPYQWPPLALTTIKPVSSSLLSSVWALRKYCFVKMSSSAFSCTVFLQYIISLEWTENMLSFLLTSFLLIMLQNFYHLGRYNCMILFLCYLVLFTFYKCSNFTLSFLHV